MNEPKNEPDDVTPYLWDRTGDVEPEVEKIENLLAPMRLSGGVDWQRVDGAAAAPRAANKPRSVVVPLFAAALAIAAVFALYVISREPKQVAEMPPAPPSSERTTEALVVKSAVPDDGVAPERLTCAALGSDSQWPAQPAPAGMRFRAANGTPLCDGGAAGKDGLVPKGAWLETDAATRVTLDVADIGQVDVAPGSRVRVVETNDKEHRLELGRGRLHAKIDAPPRLFFVDTKAATAIDLGCEYEMEVDAAGAGVLKVELGYVELEPLTPVSPDERRPPRLVPRGAECTIDPTHGPGTPVWSRSPESLRADLARFDRTGDAVALARVVEALGPKDTLTLFYIVASRAPEASRAAALSKLLAVQNAPAGASRARTLALERKAIQAWREALEPRWFPKEKP